MGQSTIREMEKQGSVTGLQLEPQEKGAAMKPCQSCMEGKATKLPFPAISKTLVCKPLEVVHADLWGPARVPTKGKRSIYILSFIDRLTSYVWSYQLQDKTSASTLAVMKEWLAMVERQAGTPLQTLRTDNGSEFMGEFNEWMRGKGIQRQLTGFRV